MSSAREVSSLIMIPCDRGDTGDLIQIEPLNRNEPVVILQIIDAGAKRRACCVVTPAIWSRVDFMVRDTMSRLGAPHVVPVVTDLVTRDEFDTFDRLTSAAQVGPWMPDIDIEDDGKGHSTERWTGKFYCGDETTSGAEATWCTYNDDAWTMANLRFISAARMGMPRLAATLRAAWARTQRIDALGPLIAKVAARSWMHDDECPHFECPDGCGFGVPGCHGPCEAPEDKRAPCDCRAGDVLALVAALQAILNPTESPAT